MKYSRFEELPVWQDAIELAVRVYRFTTHDAFNGRYSLKDQLERAAVSISNNIAEGSERLHRAEYIQFLGYAKGSAGETRSQLYLAEDLGYIGVDRATELRADVRLIGGKIYALIRSLSQ